MTTLAKKLELAVSVRLAAAKKAEEEKVELNKLQKFVRRYPLHWPYQLNFRNAKRTALQVRILHCLFEREDKVQKSKNDILAGMTTHQLWKRIYTSNPSTSSPTFRGHILDLQDKGLVMKSSQGEHWLATEKAHLLRVGRFS